MNVEERAKVMEERVVVLASQEPEPMDNADWLRIQAAIRNQMKRLMRVGCYDEVKVLIDGYYDTYVKAGGRFSMEEIQEQAGT